LKSQYLQQMTADIEMDKKSGKASGLKGGAEETSGGMSPAIIFVVALLLGALLGFGVTYGVTSASSDDDHDHEDEDHVEEEAYFTVNNYCAGSQVDLPNIDCINADGIIAAVEQAGGDVSLNYTGGLDTDASPITTTYREAGLCPVNVHWHLGAEHRSEGEFDENGDGPSHGRRRALLAGEARLGGQCHHYDASDSKFTTEYTWEHCVDMHVGETYEIHWPHSLIGACNTPYQYQEPFYDGVFCNYVAAGSPTPVASNPTTGQVELPAAVAVQGQVFTIVNDEAYYNANLFRGMLVDPDQEMGVHITAYTGSTTGTSRDNEICSSYSPITWQVDRKCHMISASSFDKMCQDMKAQIDDMSGDLYPHGSREVVDTQFVADNQVYISPYQDPQ